MHLPLIPKTILKKHATDQRGDTRFAASARLLQSLWRSKRNLPAGTIPSDAGHIKIGSRLSKKAADCGLNFLNPALIPLIRRELIFREEGALYSEDRLWENLLSSQTLCFNLFGSMKLDRALANSFFRKLFPGTIEEITNIRFEHSPGRYNPRITEDQTAFDVFIDYRRSDGNQGFLAIEMKYTEAISSSGSYHPSYDDLSDKFSLFEDGTSPELRNGHCQQFWREILLAESTLAESNKYTEYSFVIIHPSKNTQCTRAISTFTKHLVEPEKFSSISLETCIETLRSLNKEQAEGLYDRYLDFSPIDTLLEAEVAAPVPDFKSDQAGSGETVT